MRRFISSLLVACGVMAVPKLATAQQLPSAAVPPVNIVLPNYNGVAVGEIASLEAGAFLARANDSSSGWFNPAGLSRAQQTSISGSAGVFNFTTVSPEGFKKSTGSIEQIPALVGFLIKDLAGHKGWSGGFSMSRTNAFYQAGDAEREITSGSLSERVTYSSGSEFSGWVASAGVGHATSDTFSYGGSIDLQLTTTDRTESLSDQFLSRTGLSDLLVQAHGWSWTTHLRFTFGAQYNVLPALRIGAVLRTPGILLLKSGAYVQEGTSQFGGTTTTASFFEPAGQVDHKIPFEFKAGAAYVGQRGQIEADVMAYAGAGTYPGFQSSQTMRIVTDQGLGGPPTVQELAFPTQMVDSRSVVNVAVGGQLNLAREGRFRLHGGFATDRSPVGPSDTLFNKVDMQVWTVGLSIRTKKLLGSIGLRYESGESDLTTIRPLQIGEQYTTRFDVSSLGIVYSIALSF